MSTLDLYRQANSVDLAALAIQLGLPINHSMRPVRVKCPFHKDGGTFNLTVHPKGGKWSTQHYYCHACGYGGTAIDLVRDHLGMSDREAVEYITSRPLPKPKPQEQIRVYQTRDMTSAYANAELNLFGPHGVEALAYLEGRGIDAAAAHAFMLGLWPRDNSLWSGRLTIPHLRLPGEPILAGKGRAMQGEDPKYLATSGATQSIYLFDRAMQDDPESVVLVEGELDAISLHLAIGEVMPVMGIPGVNNFKDAAPFMGRVVYVVLDNDDAGNRARYGYWQTYKSGERVWVPGIPERLTQAGAYPVIVTPQMGDVNEMLVAYGRDHLGEWFFEEMNRGIALV